MFRSHVEYILFSFLCCIDKEEEVEEEDEQLPNNQLTISHLSGFEQQDCNLTVVEVDKVLGFCNRISE